MFDSLFGMELPLYAQFFIAFVVVLALIAVTFWLIRRFSGDRVGAGQARGRQPRLAVIDAAAVDSRRRLVLIRRDNVEHLVMIGGPSDLVIEQNIVRAVPVGHARETPPSRAPGETVARGTDMVRDVPPPRAAASAMESAWVPPPLPEGIRPRSEPARSAEAARPLPDSISPPRGGAMPEPRQHSPRQPVDLPPVEMRQSPPTADVNLADMAQRLEAALRRPPPQPAARAEPPPPRPAPPREPQTRPAPPPRPAPPAEPPAQQAAPRPSQPRTPAMEQPRPAAAEPPRPPEPSRAEAAAPPSADPAPAAPPPAASAPEPPRPDPAGARPVSSKSVFDSLEEEMASLLGKPTDKP